MPDCLFCKIVRKEIPAEVLWEDERTLAFLDVHPCAPGHAMVVPKDHVNSVLELDDAHLGPVFHTVKRVTRMLKGALAPDGFTIGINHGRAAGQAIDHLHIHIIPRWANDRGGSVHSVVKNPPTEDLHTLAERVRKG